MRLLVFIFVSFGLIGVACAQSESSISSAQRTLKEQGFYYGEATGRKDADTTAALRRYQIRNGLQITGELNVETAKSLGIKGVIAPPPRATPAPTPRSNPTPAERPTPPPSSRERNEIYREPTPPDDGASSSGFAPTEQDFVLEMRRIFAGSSYQDAPLELQRRVVAGAQNLLARRGYYHDLIDGVFGPATEFAIRAFQSRFAIPVDGRLNEKTLGALGLLPRQRAPGLTAPSLHRPSARPRSFAPNGEPIYEPR